MKASIPLLLLLAVQATAEAGTKEPPAGSVAFVKDGAVWRATLAAPDQVTKVADLAGAATRMAAAADGSALLVDLGDDAAWIDLAGGAAATPTYLPCHGGRLAADGHRVLCTARGGGAVVYRMRPSLGSAPLAGVDPAQSALGRDRQSPGDRVVTRMKGALWAAPIAKPEDRAEVAPEAPVDHLSVAPDGDRAVGRYDEGEEDALFGFRLDGRAARRKLLPGVPVAWSPDSTWLAVDAPDSACAVRAVGGEYKCWDHYTALAIGPAGTLALLAKSASDGAIDVYLGQTAGARAEKPKPLLTGVRAATLLP